MIRLPQNVNEIRGEQITLRFSSAQECGYIMLFEAGSARLAHRMLALEAEVEDAAQPREASDDFPARPAQEIQADKDRAIAAFQASRHVDGEGQHCLIMTVGDAISLVSPIEQIKKMSRLGVPVTAHNFTTQQVEAAATQVLERFERSIQQVSDAAQTHDLGGMFLAGPGGMQ